MLCFLLCEYDGDACYCREFDAQIVQCGSSCFILRFLEGYAVASLRSDLSVSRVMQETIDRAMSRILQTPGSQRFERAPCGAASKFFHG